MLKEADAQGREKRTHSESRRPDGQVERKKRGSRGKLILAHFGTPPDLLLPRGRRFQTDIQLGQALAARQVCSDAV